MKLLSMNLWMTIKNCRRSHYLRKNEQVVFVEKDDVAESSKTKKVKKLKKQMKIEKFDEGCQ